MSTEFQKKLNILKGLRCPPIFEKSVPKILKFRAQIFKKSSSKIRAQVRIETPQCSGYQIHGNGIILSLL